MLEVNNFNAIRISLASPEQIHDWSKGEVTKPETINYRTLRPEKDGLFDERIFGPSRDWECYCGKYKRIRYKGIICDKCGVEVTRAKVRRERMGHIQLASPVSHIWYFKGTPSRLGILLDISPRNLERILYFALFIVTWVDEDARERALRQLEEEAEGRGGRGGKALTELEDQWAADIHRAKDESSAALAARKEELEAQRASRTAELVEAQQASEEAIKALGSAAAEEAIVFAPTGEVVVAAGEAADKAARSRLARVAKDEVERVNTEIQGIEADEEEQGRARIEDLELQRDAALDAERERLRGEADGAKEEIRKAREEIQRLAPGQMLPEISIDGWNYRDLDRKYGSGTRSGRIFGAGMGAEAVRELIERMDLEGLAGQLHSEVRTTSGLRRKKAIKRLRLIEAFRRSGTKPEWMILSVLPVIPPDLRPMVQLDGGRFATSDLNDLYRRVINRNNRLKRLLELGAPEIIIRNEKRMLQEACDALIDNGRRGRAIAGTGNHRLKSLSDMLKGKQGRFRQNLLGKRVDYSGRSVIVVGPELMLHQCGLPKKMALELFKPFVMRQLVEKGFAHNIKSAKRIVERVRPEVWDVLEDVIKDHPVLLNRAPTLHRLGIQAFMPVLVEGSAIQIHPMVCTAFNADFDGDQMAVHVPLSQAAQDEARRLMLSTANLLSPANGDPLVSPTQDMVLGCYYLTLEREDDQGTEPTLAFGSEEDAVLAYQLGRILPGGRTLGLHAPVEVVVRAWEAEAVAEGAEDGAPAAAAAQPGATAEDRPGADDQAPADAGAEQGSGPEDATAAEPDAATSSQPAGRLVEQRLRTTVGRILFNQVLPDPLRFKNKAMNRTALRDLISECFETLGGAETVHLVDGIKGIGFQYATRGGMTISISDINVPADKPRLLKAADHDVDEIDGQFQRGLITEDERYEEVVKVWQETTKRVSDEMNDNLDPLGSLAMMTRSGARGNKGNIGQLGGMRGLMADPSGRIIDVPVRSNFREGMTVLEYFISTHGARKGLADTALRTADSGYLTRRLVDVSQDVIIREDDCGTEDHVELPVILDGQPNLNAAGRVLAVDVHKPLRDGKPGKTLLGEKGELLTKPRLHEIAEQLEEHADEAVLPVRTVLKCRSDVGVCRACYGTFLATGDVCEIGDAVGIVAAQSIGEPGTQLTMRTFHTGGVAGADITHGLPRVVEIFEARNPKGAATLAEYGGKVSIEEGERGTTVVTVTPSELDADGEPLPVKEYAFPRRTRMLAKEGDTVAQGEPLNDGSLNPTELLDLHTRAGRGSTPTELYLVGEVQKVYKSQGVDIHDKHIELIVRQMMKKVRVETPGDTELLPGQLVDKVVLERANDAARSGKGEEATFEPLILGITKASLATESFLSAASFQETTKVLTDAAIEGKVDRLLGLKENVIIGKLIPAATGLKKYRGIDIEPTEPLPAAMFGGGTEAELLAALEEIGDGDGLDLSSLGLGYETELPELPELPEPGAPDDDA
ncbi:DNA-directed RNA polymerase subunit beta' [Gaiella sp.]|uniref:DNA-directed RNA polymerase subunit beta' n=1 Tax=Gaiella sp. TaxID=2663207 RepID=UPI0032C22943